MVMPKDNSPFTPRDVERLLQGTSDEPLTQSQPELTRFDRLMLPETCRITIPISVIHSRELRHIAEELHAMANEFDHLSRETGRRERSLLMDAYQRAKEAHDYFKTRAWRVTNLTDETSSKT